MTTDIAIEKTKYEGVESSFVFNSDAPMNILLQDDPGDARRRLDAASLGNQVFDLFKRAAMKDVKWSIVGLGMRNKGKVLKGEREWVFRTEFTLMVLEVDNG